MSEPVEVAMTAEPAPRGYGQHRITFERGNAAVVQTMTLTDLELAQLACLLENYQAALSAVHVRFADHTGRRRG